MHGCRWRCSTRRSASSPRSRPGQHARPTTFRCTTWGAILPPRHPPRLVRAPSIRGRRRTSRAFGLCRSEARDGGIARQPGLGSKPDRRVHRAVPMVAAPFDNLEEKASLLGARIDLEELGAAIAIVENISCAQPVNPRVGASGGARCDDAAPALALALAAPADIAVKVAEIRFPARGVGSGRPCA